MPRNKHLFIIVDDAQDPWKASIRLQLAPKMMTLKKFLKFEKLHPRKTYSLSKLFEHKNISLACFLYKIPDSVVQIQPTIPSDAPSSKRAITWSDIVLPHTPDALWQLANMLDMSVSLHVFCKCAGLCRHIPKLSNGTFAINGLYVQPAMTLEK